MGLIIAFLVYVFIESMMDEGTKKIEKSSMSMSDSLKKELDELEKYEKRIRQEVER